MSIGIKNICIIFFLKKIVKRHFCIGFAQLFLRSSSKRAYYSSRYKPERVLHLHAIDVLLSRYMARKVNGITIESLNVLQIPALRVCDFLKYIFFYCN